MTYPHTHREVTPSHRVRLGRRAQWLAGASVAYNVVEAVVAVAAGLVAGSVALVGFGLDSAVEVSSSLIILWQFRHRMPESRERQALRLMAVAFFALAAYVTVESVRALFFGSEPDASPVGIGLAVASLIVMPFLSWAQRRTGRALGSPTVVADSTQTLLCTYLSAVLLVGLVLNATLGWRWADPVAGLVIAVVAVKEGVEAWRGEGCCTPAAAAYGGGDGCRCAESCADACCTRAASPTIQLSRRPNELCGLRLADLHLVPSAAHLGCQVSGAHLHVIRREDNENKALAKSIWPRVVPVTVGLVRCHNAYRAERDRVPAAEQSDYLLVNLWRAPLGRALRPDAVEQLFVRLSAKVGFYVRPHMLRHSFASQVALATKDPALVKELLGHASVRSTEVYLHARWNDMRAAVDSHAHASRSGR